MTVYLRRSPPTSDAAKSAALARHQQLAVARAIAQRRRYREQNGLSAADDSEGVEAEEKAIAASTAAAVAARSASAQNDSVLGVSPTFVISACAISLYLCFGFLRSLYGWKNRTYLSSNAF